MKLKSIFNLTIGPLIMLAYWKALTHGAYELAFFLAAGGVWVCRPDVLKG